MRIAMGADHRGGEAMRGLRQRLTEAGHELCCHGGDEAGTIDYPDTAWPVATAVVEGRADRGILVCGTGIGSCIAANKVRGVRAALAHDEVGAEMARRHHDANVLCLAADLLGAKMIDRVVEVFLTVEFEGGRHARRIGKIADIEDAGVTAVV